MRKSSFILLLTFCRIGAYQKELRSREAAFRQAAELVKKNSKQEVHAEADFLQIEKAREMLISAPEGNLALLLQIAEKMGEAYAEIVNEVLE